MSESPSSSPMVLRSVCRKFGCHIEYSGNENSSRDSPRHDRIHSNHVHHHHHHHNHNELFAGIKTSRHLNSATTSVNKSSGNKTISKSKVTPPKVIFSLNNFNSLRSVSKVNSVDYEASYSLSTSKRSYSDYSSGNEDSDTELREKTDYTYAESNSYSSRVTPNVPCESPNMARTHLPRSYQSSNCSSSSEDSYILFGKGLHSSSVYSNGQSSGHNARNSSYKSNKLIQNAKGVGYPAVIKHSYGFDSEYSESEEDYLRMQCRDTESSGFLSTAVPPLQKFFLLRWLTSLNTWLWYSLWSNLYKVVCHILLCDTWFLSRSSCLSKRKLYFFVLLPLFLPLLFLLGTGLLHLDSISVATSLRDVVWSSVKTLSSYASVVIASWTYKNVSGLNTAKVISSDSSWNVWSSVFGQNKGSVDMDFSTSERLSQGQDIHLIARNILKEELTGWMEQVTKEQNDFIRKQMDEFYQQAGDMKALHEKQLQYLSKELADLKISIDVTNRESKGDSDNLDPKFLHSKLEQLESQLHGMQDSLLLLRNCCRNQTDYIQAAERHVSSLLIQVMNGTGKSNSPFAAFGDWMRSQYVNHDELKVHVTAMVRHFSSDVSHQAEIVAQQAAASFLSQSLKELGGNITVSHHNSNSQVFTSREDVRNIVKEAIYLYDADKTGLVDYALESSGGSIVSTRCAETYNTGTAQFRLFGIPFWYTSNSPRTVIQPGVHPGQCWAFKGTHGYLVIELSARIKPTAFSMEHIPKTLSPTGSIDSAPKEFSVMGLKKEIDLEGILLGRYTYDADGEPLQFFAVEDPDVDFYPFMELRIHSNYGNPDYTCLYRFRIHGTRQ